MEQSGELKGILFYESHKMAVQVNLKMLFHYFFKLICDGC